MNFIGPEGIAALRFANSTLPRFPAAVVPRFPAYGHTYCSPPGSGSICRTYNTRNSQMEVSCFVASHEVLETKLCPCLPVASSRSLAACSPLLWSLLEFVLGWLVRLGKLAV